MKKFLLIALIGVAFLSTACKKNMTCPTYASTKASSQAKFIQASTSAHP